MDDIDKLLDLDDKEIDNLMFGINVDNNDKQIPQTCGLSFSVPKCHRLIPPSLQNIFKEIKNSYPEYIIPKHGFLKSWIKQKVLLLNSALTVEHKKSNSHQHLWSSLTDKLIKFISDDNQETQFLLMGSFAQSKSNLIDNKHIVFKTVHPSPLSAHKGFFGCHVFENIKKINW